MARGSTAAWRQDFMRARRDFERWRKSRPPGARIPEALWQAAVDLAERHGVSRTAATLGLDYYALKKRLGANLPPRQSAPDRPVGFVELPLGALTTGVRCVAELESADGSRLRLELSGLGAPELEGLVRSLRSRAG